MAKDPPVVHVYDVVEYGRRFYRTLTYSSDAALSLVSRPPSGVSVAWHYFFFHTIAFTFQLEVKLSRNRTSICHPCRLSNVVSYYTTASLDRHTRHLSKCDYNAHT